MTKFKFEPNNYDFQKGKVMLEEENALYDFDNYIDEDSAVENNTVKTITDNFRHELAFKLGIVGVGQCGVHLARTMHDIGYRRVLFVDSALADLSDVEDQIAILPIDKNGAGKDPKVGRDRVVARATAIRNAMFREFGEDFNKIIVCAGLGGGTGSGGGPAIVKIATEIIKSRGGDPKKDVIAFVTLPDPAIDGPRQCYNALEAYGKIITQNVPCVTVDNSSLSSIVKTTLGNHWGPINLWIMRTFHMFNVYSNRTSALGTFDGSDLNDIIARGRLMFSAFRIQKVQDRYSLSDVMSKNLERSLFARCDLSTATAAGCVMLINPRVQDKLKMADIAPVFQELNTLMRPNSTLHRGVYFPDWTVQEQEKYPDLFCYVILGGLDHPKQTLESLFEKARNYNQAYGSLSAFLSPDPE
jgi:cell division GTPase FtsZ